MSVLSNLIWDGFTQTLTNIYNSLLNALSGGMVDSMSAAVQILDSAYVSNIVLTAQVIAGSLLALKLAYDTLFTYILHAHGEPTDAGTILVRMAMAAAGIAAVPWLARKLYSACTDLASQVAGSQAIDSSQFSPFVMLTNPTIILTIVAIIGLLVWLLILVQTAVRAVELSVLSVVGPVMAVGLTNADQGLFAVWWKELVVLSMSQVIQIFLVKGALTSLSLVSVGSLMQMLFFLAWLWVAYKTPAVLRQFAYSTGVGGAVAGGVQQGGTILLMRRVFAGGA